MYKNKFNKYKNKYFNLITQNGGNELYLIIRNTASLEDLIIVGAGVPHVVCFDPIINSIIKFRKRERNPNAILYNKVPKQFFISEKMKQESKSNDFKVKLNNYKHFFSEPEITELLNHTNIINTIIEINKIIYDLPSFLQILGYVIYPNIINDYNKHMYLGSIYYPYYHSLKDRIVINYKNKDNFLKIINEFKTLNLRGYYHGDLQENCRNIVSINTNEFKVIDIDSISKIFNNDFVFINHLENSFKDIKDLIKCLNYHNITINSKKYELIINYLINKLYQNLFKNNKLYEIIDIIEPPWVKYQLKIPKIYTDFISNKSNWATTNLYVFPYIKDIINILYSKLINDFQGFFINKLEISISNIDSFVGKKLTINSDQILKLKIKEDGTSILSEYKDYHFNFKNLPTKDFEILITKK